MAFILVTSRDYMLKKIDTDLDPRLIQTNSILLNYDTSFNSRSPHLTRKIDAYHLNLKMAHA